MVSGQSGGKKRNTRRYYVCGAYQRKGKSVCKFKSLYKEKTEEAVIDALIREMSILLRPGMLAEELELFAAKQTDTQRFGLASTEREIELHKVRIQLAEQQGNADKQYLEQMKQAIANLEQRRTTLQKEISASSASVEITETIQNQLRYFVDHIRIEASDRQNALLKQYVMSITVNLVSEVMDVHMRFSDPNFTTALFEKHLYVSLR